jgi:2-keto-4-pentenoate hydratase/2-oxohepta-3-ene-1,7-dioic acid hydratase in catechol pathway
MRLTNVDGRLCLESDGAHHDVEALSNGRFSADPQAVYDDWSAFAAWAESLDLTPITATYLDVAPERLGPPVPAPRQVFAIGLNYSEHARESGFARPEEPVVFTKYPSSLCGPAAEVEHPGGSLDWEVELVVVIGPGGRDIPTTDAWSHVAGLTAGQDLSERERQHSGPAPQFSLAKSHRNFSPIGPAVVTLDEFSSPDDLGLGCEIDGDVVQSGRTTDLIFPVDVLIARLSRVVELYPGDLIFTGTPAGVGAGRVPPRFLQVGETLTSWVDGIGSLTQRIVPARVPAVI